MIRIGNSPQQTQSTWHNISKSTKGAYNANNYNTVIAAVSIAAIC